MIIGCLSLCLLNFMGGYLVIANPELFYYLSLPFVLANLCLLYLIIVKEQFKMLFIYRENPLKARLYLLYSYILFLFLFLFLLLFLLLLLCLCE